MIDTLLTELTPNEIETVLEATRNAPAFASAMTRLANQNLAEVDPEPWVEWLLYSHPALEKRIQMARRYAPSVSNRAA